MTARGAGAVSCAVKLLNFGLSVEATINPAQVAPSHQPVRSLVDRVAGGKVEKVCWRPDGVRR